ncbi:hypothetical protein HMPREF0183_0388 [Brevibacterium mcbrellneri ATCC 49030]|uniref:Uncharacterized protein n=1 Tax=Brevibacterium mcbrellneri ATCC 49030 TaxID=585530 RepID=D4YKC8_9MICO|nr:hypothetical protein HMPREF0183_0388 [Brevibacterium mcbrellneri ATCC 49030]
MPVPPEDSESRFLFAATVAAASTGHRDGMAGGREMRFGR